MITSQNRPGFPDFSRVTLKNMGRPGDEANSIYCTANALRIIKFEWLTQTNCETQQCNSCRYYPGGLPRPIIGQHSLNLQDGCVVYYSLQEYTGLIIRNAFAQQYTE